jgi:hypothetical protein
MYMINLAPPRPPSNSISSGCAMGKVTNRLSRLRQPWEKADGSIPHTWALNLETFAPGVGGVSALCCWNLNLYKNSVLNPIFHCFTVFLHLRALAQSSNSGYTYLCLLIWKGDTTRRITRPDCPCRRKGRRLLSTHLSLKKRPTGPGIYHETLATNGRIDPNEV